MKKVMYGISLFTFIALTSFLFSEPAVALSPEELKTARTEGIARYQAWKLENARLRAIENAEKEALQAKIDAEKAQLKKSKKVALKKRK
ncbi:MAG: hypothetical protein ABL958_17240 [Bdellovibrionia bacterium]